MSAIWKRLEDKDEGFTLIELLVVVIIIGILAAIAIPVFLNQRSSAWRSAAESDVRNAAIEVETYYTQEQSYPTDATDLVASTDMSVNVSTDVTLTYELAGDDQQYCIAATHAQLPAADAPHAVYDSVAGGVVDACTIP